MWSARVRAELPVVTVMVSDRNLGFAGGCNLGIRDHAGVDHVALVNSDASVEPDWLAPLVAALDSDPAIAAACPKVVYADTGLIDNVGVDLGKWGRGADRGHLEPDHGQYDEPSDVFAWCGAAVLLRASHLDTVGEFDERLFLYCEDLELAWRGRAFGGRYRTVPESVVRHVHGASTVAGSPRPTLLQPAQCAARGVAPRPTVDDARSRHPLRGGNPVRRDPAPARRVTPSPRAFAGFLRLAPAMFAHERMIARRHTTTVAVRWTNARPTPESTTSR